MDDGQALNIATADPYHLNKIINSLQRYNSVNIQDDEEIFKKTLSSKAQIYIKKIQFLSENIEEEWLRQNHMPKNLRCYN